MENSITNTLFRFVSLRAPEKIKKTIASLQFVSELPQLQTGIFFDAVENRPPGTTKSEALLAAAEEFESLAFSSEDQVKELNPELFDFADWLIYNRTNYTNEELLERAEGIEPLDDRDRGVLQQVWDNLFYQTTSQKSFYLKEILMQMLTADNLVRKIGRTEEDIENNKLLAQARVSLPDVLFDESADISEPEEVPTGNTPALPNKATRKEMAVSKAETANKNCQNLKKELEQLQKNYQKSYREAYDEAYKQYQEEIEPLLRRYREDVEQARKSFCSTSYNPEIPYNSDDPCQQPDEVPYPDLPPFEFTFDKEIDPEKLEEDLSYESYITLLDVLGYEFPREGEDRTMQKVSGLTPQNIIANYDTYDSINEQVNHTLTLNNEVIIDNTDVSQPEVSIGGIRIPVVQLPVALRDNMYGLYTVRTGLTSVYTLKMNVPEQWEVISIDITKQFTTGPAENQTVYAPNSRREEGILVLQNFFSYTFPNYTLADGPKYDFEIKFTNGCTKTISQIDSMNLLNQDVTGLLQGNACNPVKGLEQRAFVPSGFGFKQIGVAEYLKVEQTVHCYLEGEVSHIENIMAREYREKSTRRLVRNEETITTESETEREQLTDTQTTDRFEMQSEVAKIIQQNKDVSAAVNAGYNRGGFFLNGGASFSSSTSKEDSTHQAITEAKEITERALDRVVTRVREERIRKITEEFEENNKHGFDNRRGDKHVVGVYRWVDKLYKNQIYNYGKRMMFEFMIPDPAKLHLLGMEIDPDIHVVLTPPVDPRTAPQMMMKDFRAVDETKAAYWAGLYNAEIETPLDNEIYISDAFADGSAGGSFNSSADYAGGKSFSMDIPENYKAMSFDGRFGFAFVYKKLENTHGVVTIGNKDFKIEDLARKTISLSHTLDGVKGKLGVGFHGGDVGGFSISLRVKCQRTNDYYNQWKQDTFKAIMDAYYEALAEYERKVAEEDAKAVHIKGTNPGFYREVENTILRKNCISYLIDQNPNAKNTYGKDLTKPGSNSFESYEIKVDKNLDEYASFVKFIEQAFEWNIISYSFYPFYWGPRSGWRGKYQFDESNDPTFRAFVQAGLARVIVTVTPGFEEAVQLYLTTGKIWNGGQVPVIGDKLFRDLIADVRKPTGEPQGKAWLSRVPTSLTILQADTIGLKVEKALPCNCDEDPDDFVDGTILPPCNSNFEKTDYQLNGGGLGTAALRGTIEGIQEVENKNIKVVLKTIEGDIQDIAYTYGTEQWDMTKIPAGKYELDIDTEDVLPDSEYQIMAGFKQQTVELEDEEIKEIILVVKKI